MQVKKFTGGEYVTNSYVVYDKNEAAVIDAPARTAKRILAFIKENALSAALVVATHVHWDHVEDAAKLCKMTGAKFCIHSHDEENQAEINSIFEGEAGVIKSDRSAGEGDKINVGKAVLEVLHTPGHTPGSVCLYGKKEGALFSGDTLFARTYGRVDFPLGSPQDMAASLVRLAGLPAATVVYPGHGPETTIGKEGWLRK